MDDSLARERLTAARVARLATMTSEAKPHIVPCCFALVGEKIYTAVDEVKPKSTAQLRRLDNIDNHPPIALLVDHYDDDWSALWWIRVDGTGHVVDDATSSDGARVALAQKYVQYRERPPPGPIIAIEISQIRSWP